MHIYKIYKKILIVNFFLLIYLFIFFSHNLLAEECQKFNDKLLEAKKHFSVFKEIELNYTLREAFITNYNKFTRDERKLVADKIILFMILDSNLWYIFAAKEGCLVFWLDLEPDRFIELIDGGSISKNQGQWRIE